eukprot:SM000031S11605  [mRNA]  locus=s31:629378:631611:- [translate_table: standard]
MPSGPPLLQNRQPGLLLLSMVVSTHGDVHSKDRSERSSSTAMAAPSTSSPGGCDGDDEGAGESFVEPAMFVCESYALRQFAFGPEPVVLRTLLASSTDYDLTGQIVWPGAELLATHLAASPGELAGAAVLELGAGVSEQATLPPPHLKSAVPPSMDSRELTWAPVPSCCTGLVGLLCAWWCSKVVMTDHNDVVLKVLQSNIDLHNEEIQASGHHQGMVHASRLASSWVVWHAFLLARSKWQPSAWSLAAVAAEVSCAKLEWGDEDQTECIAAAHPAGFDLIIGADIYILSSRSRAASAPLAYLLFRLVKQMPRYQQASIPRLFDTVLRFGRRPAQGRPSSRMLLAYVFRTRSVDVLVHAEAEARGLRLVEVPGTRRKVASGTLEGLVYEAAVPDLGSSDSVDSGGTAALT